MPPRKPTHRYHFHKAIFHTNRQIYSEAAPIFRQNLLVSLSCAELRYHDTITILVFVAKGRHADQFQHHSLEVHLGPLSKDGKALHFPRERTIIAGEDVPQTCTMLPGICIDSVRSWDAREYISSKMGIEIKVRSIAITENEKSGFGSNPPSVKWLLEPFRRLRGFRVRVEGHVTASYKESIETSAAEQPPTAVELVSMVSVSRDEGNEAIRNGSLDTALTRFQSALDMLISAYMRFYYLRRTLQIAEYPDDSTMIAMDILQISLRSLLADTYLKAGQYTTSYRSAQDFSTWCLDLNCDDLISARPDLVRMMFCKVLAGKALGEPVQALRDLDEALKLCPNDESMKNERTVLCALIQKRIHNDVRTSWADALKTRTAKSKKAKKHQSSAGAGAYIMPHRRDLESMIESE